MTGTPEYEQWKRDMAQAETIVQKMREHPRVAYRAAELLWNRVAGPWENHGNWAERKRIGRDVSPPNMAYVNDNGRGWWEWHVWVDGRTIRDESMCPTQEEAMAQCDAILDSRGVILP